MISEESLPNMLDCDIVLNKLNLQSRYYIHFQTNALEEGMNSLIFLAMS